MRRRSNHIYKLTDLSGKMVRGYQFKERLWYTNLTATYLAQDLELGHRVFIKYFLPNVIEDYFSSATFREQAQLNSDTAGITPILEAWEDVTGAYMVTPYKRTLATRIKQRTVFDLKTVQQMMDYVTSGLAVIHEYGAIHGNINQATILMDHDQYYLAGDYIQMEAILAREMRQYPDKLNLVTRHIPPEMRNGIWPGTLLDIYALGMTLFEILSLQPAPTVHTDAPLPVMNRYRYEPHPELLTEVIHRATASDPAERYQDIESFAQAFRQAVQQNLNIVTESSNQPTQAPTQYAAGSGGLANRIHEITTRFPQYKEVKEIGIGGMGTVYRALHSGLNHTHAIKVLSLQALRNEELRSRLMLEARTMAKLDHPHIVKVYDVYEHEGCIIMEFIDGPDLEQFRPRTKTMTLKQVLDLLEGVGDALDYAHKQGVIHRDVKPSNILLKPRGGFPVTYQAMLSDFGLVKDANTSRKHTKLGDAFGTIEFMAPEQMQDASEVDHRADVYSFGVMVYQLLTTKLPFRGDSQAKVIMSVMNDPIPDPRQFAPDMQAHVALALMKVLQKSREARFNTVAAFITALRGKPFVDKT